MRVVSPLVLEQIKEFRDSMVAKAAALTDAIAALDRFIALEEEDLTCGACEDGLTDRASNHTCAVGRDATATPPPAASTPAASPRVEPKGP